MIWIFLLLLIAFSVLAYLGGRRLATRRSAGVRAHSRPGQHGLYALIWVGMPALVMLIAASIFSTPLERQMLAAKTWGRAQWNWCLPGPGAVQRLMCS